eukprot:5467176-Amphidinium_carterae.1
MSCKVALVAQIHGTVRLGNAMSISAGKWVHATGTIGRTPKQKLEFYLVAQPRATSLLNR